MAFNRISNRYDLQRRIVFGFDEKRNLFNKKIIRVEFSSDKSLKVYSRFFREKRFIKKQDFWLESESIVCC